MHRGLSLAGTSEHDKHRVGKPEQARRCAHTLLSVVPVVSIRVEGGYRGRCLLCGTNGPIRGNADAARGVLLNRVLGNEQQPQQGELLIIELPRAGLHRSPKGVFACPTKSLARR
jgi:hypothetical protein